VSDAGFDPSTLAIVAGRTDSGNSLAPVLWASSTWTAGAGDAPLDELRTKATGFRPQHFYSRYGNPTVRAFEEAVATLEGAQDALAFASGMGASASTVLALCSSGDHVVASRDIYGGTMAFLAGPCARLGIETTFVDSSCPGALAAAVRPVQTALVIVETPSNPLLRLTDLDDVAAITGGAITMVDSTLATPIGQRPLAHGAHLVMHSATKGLAGHNDATLGVVAGSKELLDTLWSYAVLHGATPSPFDALNAIRGMRTLAVRVERQAATASQLAAVLEDHPSVIAAHHPSLPSHPQAALAKSQLAHPGTVLSFEVADRTAAQRLLAQLRLVRVATSLGGPETLVCHPASSTHAGMSPDALTAAGITDGLVRMSVGLEHVEDLIADVTAALTS
jgi:cystathionine beta-lyase/cystathionine gamma-synthase